MMSKHLLPNYNYLIILPQECNLLFCLVLHLCPVLTETLKLVHKLIYHIPQPLVWQLHINHSMQHNLKSQKDKDKVKPSSFQANQAKSEKTSQACTHTSSKKRHLNYLIPE